MRSHEALADLVMSRQPKDEDSSREADVIYKIIKAHYESGVDHQFDRNVIEIIEDTYVFTDFQEDSE